MKVLFTIYFLLIYSASTFCQNAGIGQPNALSKLDVNGNIQISNASIPMGLSELWSGSSSPIADMNINDPYWTNSNWDYPMASFYIHPNDSLPLYRWNYRSITASNISTIMAMDRTGSLLLTSGFTSGIIKPCAKLEVNSTTKGFLPPRMTNTQRDAIVSPAQGLMIYCTNCKAGEIEVYDGTNWKNMAGGAIADSIAIGDHIGGGIVGYILEPWNTGYVAGEVHGLIVAPYDQSSAAPFGCYNTSIGGTAVNVGTGQANTTKLVNGCNETGTAAQICNDLVLNGFSDWYLPSSAELAVIANNELLVGSFTDNAYWSSTEGNPSTIYGKGVYFSPSNNTTTGFEDSKNITYRVRAIRAF